MAHEIYNKKKHQTTSAKRNQDENSGDGEFESLIRKTVGSILNRLF